MTVHYDRAGVTVHHGDCLDVLRGLPDASVDAVCTDPPYGLEFMGKDWDRPWAVTPKSSVGFEGREDNLTLPSHRDGRNANCRACGGRARGAKRCECAAPKWDRSPAQDMRDFQQWCELWAVECLRVLKPGGHMLAFGGTRTFHRLACAVEDAGFEIRDSIAWLYGSGFPKSLDVSKAIDRKLCIEAGTHTDDPDHNCGREVVGVNPRAAQQTAKPGATTLGRFAGTSPDLTAPATDAARQWQGWGTALKPGWEIAVHATKPVGTLARIGSHLDALEDACRPTASSAAKSSAPTRPQSGEGKGASARASAATQPEVGPARPTPTGEAAGSCDQTDTSPSESTATTFSNTVTSWRECWAELCEATNTSTTGTTSSTTTDLETLWSCLSKITPASTTKDRSSLAGPSSLVPVVDAMFAAAVLNSRATRTLTAIESATSPTQDDSQLAEGSQLEPVVVARKPLTGTVAQTVQAHGTGALNIDATRIAHDEPAGRPSDGMHGRRAGIMGETIERHRETTAASTSGRWPANVVLDQSQADALDQQSGERHAGGHVNASEGREGTATIGPTGLARGRALPGVNDYSDSGGASRFMYTAKASSDERVFYYRPTCECEDAWPTHTPSAARATDATTAPKSSSTSRSGSATTGDESPRATRSTTSTGTSSTTNPATSSPSLRPITSASTPVASSGIASGGSPAASAASSSPLASPTGISAAKAGRSTAGAVPVTSRGWSATSVCGSCGAPTRRESHATVKPLSLMRWLVRLVTPPGGTVLEPFAGSGTTVEACILEGFRCVAVEREADYLPLIVQRINRRRDPIAYTATAGEDLGLFGLFGEETA